ncbi:MAG: hypothetical protein J6D87_10175 [Clostridia bacterium]|nr:hypothetical protein [Clostridia bacterium]
MFKTKKYLEEKARQTLSLVCSYNIEDLICEDKPDIQDRQGKRGIEVVQDMDEEERKREVFIEQVWDIPYDQIDSEKIKRFQSEGGEIRPIENNRIRGAILGKPKPNTPDHLIETIMKKVHLLNKGQYVHCDSYELYVFVQTVSIDDAYDSYVIDIMNAIPTNNNRNYEKVFLDYNYGICICDLKNQKFQRISISPETRKTIEKETMKTYSS